MMTRLKNDCRTHILPSNVLLAHCAMLVAVALVAGSFPIAASLVQVMDARLLLFIRFSLATLVFTPVVIYRFGWQWPNRREVVLYTALSLCNIGFFMGMFVSLQYTSAIRTSALYTLMPLFVAIIDYCLNRQRISLLNSSALLFAAAGAFWLCLYNAGTGFSFTQWQWNKGDGIFVIGCVAMAFYMPILKRYSSGQPAMKMTFWTLLFSAVILLIICLPIMGDLTVETITRAWEGILYLAVACTLITFFLMQYSTLNIGATKSSAYSYLTPVYVILISVVLGQAQDFWALLPGVFVILTAIFVVQRMGNDV